MTSFDDDIISGRSRRRCVKGRVSYLEPDNLGPSLSEEINLNEEPRSDAELPPDPVCHETLETEEYDEEPVTIDLSDFLTETALLAEALTENASESAAALSDCHSQFRVTSSKTNPPLCPVGDLPSLKELTLNEKTVPSNGSGCTPIVNPSSSISDVPKSSNDISADLGEGNVLLKEETIFTSPLPAEVSIAKTPMNQSNACQKDGDIIVGKDVLENTAAEALGKFPIVRCEKLNMENFVKKNTIKVGNWPLPKVSSTPKSRVNASKSIKKLKSVNPKTPKLFNKPITFNRLVPKNSIAPSNMVRSILVNPFEPSGLYSIGNSNVHRFVSSQNPVRHHLNEQSLSGKSIIRLVNKSAVHNSFTHVKKFPIITSVNKMGGHSKTFKIISPKKVSPAVAEHKNVGITPILPKPIIEAITSPVLLNDASYTVIEPYVDDPSSPVRPKPILTVPLEVIPSIEGVETNELTNSSIELTPGSKVSSKYSKSSRSVFLNGAIKQTSVLTRHKKEQNPKSKNVLTENNLVKLGTDLQNSSDSDFEEVPPINKAKTAVVDAMTSVFSKNCKKPVKSKQGNKDVRNQPGFVADSSLFGCQSYNNSLNDILFGFSSVEDLVDENFNDDKNISAEFNSPSHMKKNYQPNVTLKTLKKVGSKSERHTTHSNVISSYPEHIFAESYNDSDTLSASECGEDSDTSVSQTPVVKKDRRNARAIKKRMKRGRRSSRSIELNENKEDALPRNAESMSSKLSTEISTTQISEKDLELNESKNMSPDIKKEENIEKTTEVCEDLKDDDVKSTSLKKNTKETRSSSRGRRKLSNDQNIVKQEPVEEIFEASSKKPFKANKGHLHFIRSRLKRNAKAKQSVKVVKKGRKCLSRPSDIIQEIKTITSGSTTVKGKKTSSKENIINSSESDAIYPTSKSNAKHHKRKVKSIRPKSKKKIKTLKVLFKRSKQKQISDSSELPFDEMNNSPEDKSNESRTDPHSIDSTSRDEISKPGSPCADSIADLPCEKSESSTTSALSEKTLIPPKSPEEVCSDILRKTEVLDSTELNQNNLDIKNSVMESVMKSDEFVLNEPVDSFDPDYGLKLLDAVADSSLREQSCSEQFIKTDELVSGQSDQSYRKGEKLEVDATKIVEECDKLDLIVAKESADPHNGLKEKLCSGELKKQVSSDSGPCHLEFQNSKSDKGKDKFRIIDEKDSEESTDSKDGFIDSDVNSTPREEISSGSVGESKMLISGDLDSSNLELQSSEIKARNNLNESPNSDLTVTGENTGPIDYLKSSLVADVDSVLKENSSDEPMPVSGELDQSNLEGKNSVEKSESDILTVPKESCDSKGSLQDTCKNIDSTSVINIENQELAESNSVSAISENSKAENLSEEESETQNIVKSKVGRKRKKRKSCSKLKTSKTESDLNSFDINNWYVSERKTSTECAEYDPNSSSTTENKRNFQISNESSDLVSDEASDAVAQEPSCKKPDIREYTSKTLSEDSSKLVEPNVQLINNNTSEVLSDSNAILETSLQRIPSSSNSTSDVINFSSENVSEVKPLDNLITCNKSGDSNVLDDEILKSNNQLENALPELPKNYSDEQNKATNENFIDEGHTLPKQIKQKPINSEESANQISNHSMIDLEVEGQILPCDEESDTIPPLTIRRKRGRPRKNSAKSEEIKAKKSQPISECGSAEITLKKGPKGTTKITNFFKPKASESTSATMESVPVPVEVTSVPEVVTPEGATLPVETSIDAAIVRTAPSESTLPLTTSLNIVPVKAIFVEAAPTEAMCVEKTSTDSTCLEEPVLIDHSASKSPGEATPLDVASSTSTEASASPVPTVEAPALTVEASASPTKAPASPTKAPASPAKAPGSPAKAPAAPAKAPASPAKVPASPDKAPASPAKASPSPAKAPVSPAKAIATPGTSKPSVNIPNNRGKKRKYCPEAVQVPFQCGWMRELVHRGTEGPKIGQKMSDIYYFTPEGIKLRSMVEIGNYLSKHTECTLTLDNFTFAKECIYREPFEKERSAKQKSVLASPPVFYQTKILDRSKEMDAAKLNSPMKKFAPPLPSMTPKLTIKKVNQGQGENNFTCILGESSNSIDKTFGDAKLSKKSRSSSQDTNAHSAKKSRVSSEKQLNSVSVTPKEKSCSQSLTSENSERTFTLHSKDSVADVSQIQNTLKVKLGGSKTSNSSVTQSRAKLKPYLPKNVEIYQRPCSFHCAVAKYQVPSVKCALCLCLFHPHCVPSIARNVGYACKSCISSKLALYETVRNPLASSFETAAEDLLQDVPLDDIDSSTLFPEIQLKVFKSQLKVYCMNGNQLGNAAAPNSGNSSGHSVAKPTLPMSVPYMPCLVTHLLRPPPPPNQGRMQIAPKPFQPVKQTGGSPVLPNYAPAIVPDDHRPVLIHCSPNGRTVVRKGLLVSAPVNSNPLSALQSLSHEINPSSSWSSVSGPRNSNIYVQRIPAKNKVSCSNLNEVPSKFRKVTVPSQMNGSMLAASLSGRIPSDSSCTLVNQTTSDVNKYLTSYDCMKGVFKMLDTCDLLRAGQVCRSWNDLSTQSYLWEKVKFSNLMVTSWENCCLFLKKVGTTCLDFRDIIHPCQESPFENLEDYISILNDVQEVLFDQLPSSLLQSVVLNLHQLKKLKCDFVTDASTEPEIWNSTCNFKLSSLQGLNRLTKLKINSGGKIVLNPDPEYLMPFLPNLRYLTLTGFEFGSHINLECLSMHKELISLELGDCSDIQPEVFILLGSLKNLRCLRLENGGSIEDTILVDSLKEMESLEILELMNFKIPNNFEEAFKHFKQLLHLNIWPDTTTEGSQVNNNLFQAMTICKDLSYACWGVITDGENAPESFEIKSSLTETEELNYEQLFDKLVDLLPECRVEVKFVPRRSWKEFCSVRE